MALTMSEPRCEEARPPVFLMLVGRNESAETDVGRCRLTLQILEFPSMSRFVTVGSCIKTRSGTYGTHTIYIIKGDMFICLFVCLSVADGRPNDWPIKTKLGIGTHVDPGSVLVKGKVKVMWCHLANANKTPYRGPQGPRE